MTTPTGVHCTDCQATLPTGGTMRIHQVLEHHAPTGLLKREDLTEMVETLARMAAEQTVDVILELHDVREAVLAIHRARDDGSCVVCFCRHPCSTAEAVGAPS